VDMQVESGNRLLPQAILPIWDMDETVKELARLHDAGIRGFTITDKPHMVGLPDLNDPYFEPMWSLANELGTVVNFHIGSGAPYTPPVEGETVISTRQSDIYWESFGPQRRLAVLATQFYMSNVRIIVNMCMSDMFDRYPNVKIASAESGIGWVPFVLEAMEYQLDEMVTNPHEAALQQRRPKEYFRSNVYVMTWFERSAWRVIDDIGVDNVMVMTDVPHPTALYPHNREHFATVTAHMTEQDRRKVLQDNGAALYRIDLP
jgi:predicted TIM-barrel fold metal-dependent hydrolase